MTRHEMNKQAESTERQGRHSVFGEGVVSRHGRALQEAFQDAYAIDSASYGEQLQHVWSFDFQGKEYLKALSDSNWTGRC